MLYSREVKNQGMHHERQTQVWRAALVSGLFMRHFLQVKLGSGLGECKRYLRIIEQSELGT